MTVCRMVWLGLLGALALAPVAESCVLQVPAAGDQTADPARFAGTWTGALDVGAVRLHLVFQLKPDGDRLVATLDSPDQGARGIPLDEAVCAGSTLTLASAKLKARYDGELDAAGERITGTWSQSGREFALELSRTAGSAERLRPQTPRPPFSYRVEEAVYPHLTAGFHLGATLSIPAGGGKFPAVLLVSGSGAQDRDESVFEHKPFAVLADHLTNAGMVVLRVDDRGVGATGTDGHPQDDTTADFATDVQSSLAWLRSRPEVDPGRIGLIGHSEGALVGAMVAAGDESLAFLILLAGPGVRGDELLMLQSEKIARASGASEPEINRLRTMQQEVFSIIRNQPDIEAGKREAREILLSEYARLDESERKSVGSADLFDDQHAAVIGVPWFRYFVAFDPGTVLDRVACPVLALAGGKDLQVPPEQNLSRIQRLLEEGRARDVTVKVLPDLNHLFQTAETGLVTEYGEIEETFSPGALAEITEWLRERGLAR